MVTSGAGGLGAGGREEADGQAASEKRTGLIIRSSKLGSTQSHQRHAPEGMARKTLFALIFVRNFSNTLSGWSTYSG